LEGSYASIFSPTGPYLPTCGEVFLWNARSCPPMIGNTKQLALDLEKSIDGTILSASRITVPGFNLPSSLTI